MYPNQNSQGKLKQISFIHSFSDLNAEGGSQLDKEEKAIAKRIVDNYRKMFDYLDEDLDDRLNSRELAVAFKKFGKLTS